MADPRVRPDPVIEAYKKDVDRTLLRENLKLTVEERLRNLMRLQRFAEEMRQAGRPKDLEVIAELAQRVLLIQTGAILRELRPAELRHADVLNEFVGVATAAEGSAGRAMRQG